MAVEIISKFADHSRCIEDVTRIPNEEYSIECYQRICTLTDIMQTLEERLPSCGRYCESIVLKNYRVAESNDGEVNAT
jgi:hypothetical protein